MEHPRKHDYMLLSRMVMDNKYYLQHPHINHLYMGNVEEQISEMKKIWESLEEKPEWLSYEEILNYEKEMSELDVKLALEKRREILTRNYCN